MIAASSSTLLSLKPGPTGLFSHLGEAAHRTRQVHLTLRRMRKTHRKIQKHGRSTGPRRLEELTLDFEALFHFGSVLLDNWAMAVGHLSGSPNANKFAFHELVAEIDAPTRSSPVLAALQPFLQQLRWLYFWFRRYRNKFVVHVARPTQWGSVLGSDSFRLFRAVLPGWENEAALNKEIEKLLSYAPEWLRKADSSYWERARPRALLGRIVENIGTVADPKARDRIADACVRAGIETPDYRVIAGELADLIERASAAALDAAHANPGGINPGLP